MEETWNKNPDDILHIAREWMINTLDDGINSSDKSDFYYLMIENLPSPLPKYRRKEYPRWDWSESAVDEATFDEFLKAVKKEIENVVHRMYDKNLRLGRRLLSEKMEAEA
tara:strand:+ start:1061 stop:1390 length:330 start_codon:yes stop_codon:yes gene_type:complete